MKAIKAIALIKTKRTILDKIASELIKTESLDEDEFVKIAGPKVRLDSETEKKDNKKA